MSVYLRKGNWCIDYYVHGVRYREKIGMSKVLAETVLMKRKVEIAEGKFLDKKKEGKIKFEDMAEMYLNLHAKPNKKSWHSDVDHIKVLKKFFSGKRLSTITTMDIEKFKIERSKNVSPASVNRALACLKCMFNKTIGWGKTDENPASKVKLFKENNKRIRYLEQEEMIKLLANCKGNLKTLVILALNTGMRKGEMLGLKWNDIDFKHNIIFLLNTKNNEKREIPMNEHTRNALIGVRKHPKSQFIFYNRNGNPLGDIKKSFFTACKKSDILNFRFHDLRHTFASHLVMNGVDLNTVRELLGHKSLQMTLRYSHLSQNHKKKAVDLLGSKIDTFWSPETFELKAPEQLVSLTV